MRARAEYGRAAPLTIEDKASGQSALQTLARPYTLQDGTTLPALTVRPFPLDTKDDRGRLTPAPIRERELPALSKVARVEHVSPLVAAGRVLLPRGAPWAEHVVKVCEGFPAVEHDEPVDVLSMALIRLSAPAARGAGALMTGSARTKMPGGVR